ncbi:MAG: TetR/AcrR family transcriptional regulator [Spirochaetota bacterium]
MKKYYSETFEKIPGEKSERILRLSLEEFRRKGLSDTRIDDIAKKAGISHGSMYTYFASKDDLIRTIIQRGHHVQRQAFSGNEEKTMDVFEIIERILSTSLSIAVNDPDSISIWLELSFEYNARFSEDTLVLEKEGIAFWKDIIQQGIEEGSIRNRIDADAAAFCVDGIVGTLMKSYISNHEKAKLYAHFGDISTEVMVKKIMTVIRGMFQA